MKQVRFQVVGYTAKNEYERKIFKIYTGNWTTYEDAEAALHNTPANVGSYYVIEKIYIN